MIVIIPSTAKQGQASQYGIMLENYHSITFYLNEWKMENDHLVKRLVLLPEEPFNELEAMEMINRLSHIHPNLLKKSIDNGIQIKLFTDKLTDEPSAQHLKGLKPRGYSDAGPTWDDVPGIGGSKLVLVKIGNSERGKGHGSLNLELHELAHSIDRSVFHFVRDDKIFQYVWKKEVNTLFPNQSYFANFPEEYFAEVFAYYYFSASSRTYLKEKAPLTYELFTKLEQI